MYAEYLISEKAANEIKARWKNSHGSYYGLPHGRTSIDVTDVKRYGELSQLAEGFFGGETVPCGFSHVGEQFAAWVKSSGSWGVIYEDKDKDGPRGFVLVLAGRRHALAGAVVYREDLEGATVDYVDSLQPNRPLF